MVNLLQLPAEGKIIDFRDKKRIITSCCLRTGVKDLRIFTEDNKEFSLPLNKVINVFDTSLNLNLSRVELVEKLKRISSSAKELQKEINLELLWDLLKEDIQKYSLYELSEIYFGSNPTSIQNSALLRNLIDDNVYFESKGEGSFQPYTEETVNNLKYQQELAQKKAQEKLCIIEWIKNILNTGDTSINAPLKPDKYLKLLKDVAVLGNEYENYNKASEFLEELGYKGGDIKNTALKYLIKLGIWDEDENLYLYQYDLKEKFSQESINQVREIEDNIDKFYDISNRLDLRYLETMTIDDEDTLDIDDAISLEYLETGYCIGIHIADVAQFIPKNTPLDKEAHNRATTIYLPDKKIEMLPSIISQNICSLICDKDRLAISVLIYFNQKNEMVNYKIVESIIKVDRRLSYENADFIIDSDATLRFLLNVSLELQRKRIERDALILAMPEIKIKVDENKQISIKKVMANTKSQILVSEFMIFANYLVAKYFYEKNIPLIYRGQPQPDTDIKLPPYFYDPLYLAKHKLLWKKSEATTKAAPHYGLGIDLYTQMTSPIRRYADLVVHRQLKRVLTSNLDAYTEEDLEHIIIFSEQMLNIANIVQRNTNRYWILKYLERNQEQPINALIVTVDDGKIHLLLEDYIIETILFPRLETKVDEGDKILVKIKQINARTGNMVLEEI